MATLDELEKKIERLEARVRDLEDEREIRELLARYGYNADACRDQALLDLYTDDATLDLGPGTRPFAGKAELRMFVDGPMVKGSDYGKRMHLQGNNVVCHIHGDSATVNSYSVVLARRGDQTVFSTAGNNQWVLRKVKGRWLIQARRGRRLGGDEYGRNLDATPE